MDTAAIASKSRGGCLTAFLAFTLLGSAVSAFFYLIKPDLVRPEILPGSLPAMSSGVLFVLGLVAALDIAFLVMIWHWQRTGVYGFILVAVGVFPLNLWIGFSVPQALTSFVGPLILVLLVRPHWEEFA